MTLDLIKPNELITLWQWITENPNLHMDDAGPKTFQAFLEHLATEEIIVLVARNGSKLLGAIGFQESTCMIRGIHFDSDARGRGLAYTAVMSLLYTLSPTTIRLRYYSDNPFMPGFVRKLGGEFIDGGGSTIRNGESVELQMVEFREKLVSVV